MKIAAQGVDCELRLSQPDDEGWMRTNVQIKVPGFGGSFTCTVEVQEWKAFVDALKQLEEEVGKEFTVAWGNMEENIHFKFTLQPRGTLSGEFRFSPENFSLGPTLSGLFEADQTFLHGWAQSAAAVLSGAR